MRYSDKKALEITTQIVEAKMSSTSTAVNKETGKAVAEFFEEIYNGVSKITAEISDD